MKPIYKTATYGIIHMTVAFFVAWAVSGSLAVALGISMLEPAFQIAAYYLHEKAWLRFGRKDETPIVAEQDNASHAPCCAVSMVAHKLTARLSPESAEEGKRAS